MTLSKKLAQQQVLKSRNEARFSSPPVEAIEESADLHPSEPSTIESGLEKLRRRFRIPQPAEGAAGANVSDQRHGTFARAVEGDDTFLRQVSHSPFGLDDPKQALCITASRSTSLRPGTSL